MSDTGVAAALPRSGQLPVEIGTPLQVAVAQTAIRFRSVVIGADPGRYLIMKAPVGPTTKLMAGDRLVVRYLHEGTAFGFQSYLSSAISQPEPLLFVACPKSVAHHSIRTEPRVRCFLPCRVIDSDGRERNGRLLDLSRTGCQCVLPASEGGEDAPTGRVELLLQLPGIAGEQRLVGSIRRAGGAGSRFDVGIEFRDAAATVQQRLDAYVSAAE